MNANSRGPNAGLAEGAEQNVELPERRSPASAVCYMNMDEAQETSVDASTLSNTIEKGQDGRVAGPETQSQNDLDRTILSEEPAPADDMAEWQPLHTSRPEPGYFSPQPIRPYGPNLPSSAPVSARPSPTSSRSMAEDAGHTSSGPAKQIRRPSVQRDDSDVSTSSVATVRPHTVDPIQMFTTPSRQQGPGPHYPNQSYAALQFQQYPASFYQPTGRPRGPHHLSSLSATHIITSGLASEPHRDIMDSGSRTVGNSPASSPGLFSPSTPPLPQPPGDGYYSSPYLHHTHIQAPKETHRADVDVDPVSGRKLINQYEVMDELGRGVHGKVKLGRNTETGLTVAIKIVDRYSKKRRLDRNTSREDKIKKEIAILKKARHPNIVSLLEVIDDPTRKKVYIVLEHVELGEVRWRTEGEKEICLVEWRRYQRESRGMLRNEDDLREDERIIARAHGKLLRQQRQRARLMHERRHGQPENGPWSLEHGFESDDSLDDGHQAARPPVHGPEHLQNGQGSVEQWGRNVRREFNMETALRSTTPPPTSRHRDSNSSTGLEGTMYGAYDTESVRGRTPSLVGSIASHHTDDEDYVPEHFRYVPLLTLEAALDVFRDTLLGLQYLHYQNVIHRDIKPANLLQTREHRIKISDFGVSYLGRARQASVDDPEESDVHDLGEAVELAKTVGTPAFYAPELCRLDDEGDAYPVTPSIDIFALGVTLYCLIFGRVPFHDHNQFQLMRIIAEEEVHIPRQRLKAVAEQVGSRPNSHGRMHHTKATNKRAPHDLEYEDVDDTLRDLLLRLLTKDPRKRITIPEIKRHPWVLQGLDNFGAWVEETDPDRSSQGRRIEVSKDDMEQAVVPITLIDRVRSGVRKTLDTVLGMGRRGGSRRRAQSTATNQEPPNISAGSSSSTISQEGRRPSLAMNQSIFEALSRSRDPDHPLSQSVTASPEARERAKFFTSNSRTGSPAHSVESIEHLAPLTGSSFRAVRLERSHSTMSSAASIRTIRQSDVSESDRSSSPGLPPPPLPGTPTALETPGGSNLGGIFGGVPRLVNSVRSRELLNLRLPQESSKAQSDRLLEPADDPHSGPSLALSTTLAAGHLDQPDVLKGLSPSLAKSPLPRHSEHILSESSAMAISRQSSTSSASSSFNPAYAGRNQSVIGPSHATDSYTYQQPEQLFNGLDSRIQDETLRSRANEEAQKQDRPLSMSIPRSTSPLSQPRRPSIFDNEMLSQRQRVEDYLNHDHVTSLDANPGCFPPSKALTSSSSEDHFASISQSTSNPSIPSVVSADSSVAPEEYRPVQPPSVAATPSNDSINQFGAHIDDPAGYDGDGDHPLESEDEESDEEFIVMGRKKPKASKPSGPASAIASATTNDPKRYLSGRRRSARTGSSGTVKKIGTTDQDEQSQSTSQ